jgi:hypothetical protein
MRTQHQLVFIGSKLAFLVDRRNYRPGRDSMQVSCFSLEIAFPPAIEECQVVAFAH